MSKVFISHAAADAALARHVAKALAAGTPPLDTFIASRPGDIRADAEWLPSIQAELLRADSFLILLTPNSASRVWVMFETGVAWFANRVTVLARTSRLAVEEIPIPLGSRQIYRLDQAEELAVIAHNLGTTLKDPIAVITAIRGLPEVALAGLGEQAWEGILFDGQYYAWAGPLLSLEDRGQAPCPPGLVEALRDRGLAVRTGRADKLDTHLGRGRALVFATDRRSWRRPVASQDQFLLVGGTHNSP